MKLRWKGRITPCQKVPQQNLRDAVLGKWSRMLKSLERKKTTGFSTKRKNRNSIDCSDSLLRWHAISGKNTSSLHLQQRYKVWIIWDRWRQKLLNDLTKSSCLAKIFLLTMQLALSWLVWRRQNDFRDSQKHRNTQTPLPEKREKIVCVLSVSFLIKRVLIFFSNVLDRKMSFMFSFPRSHPNSHTRSFVGALTKKTKRSLNNICVF